MTESAASPDNLRKPLSHMLESRTTLYFSRHAGEVAVRGKNLVILREGETETRFALDGIRRVVLLGHANVDTFVLYRLMRHGIAVDWLDIFGRPLGQLLSLDDTADRSLAGQVAFRQNPASLELARLLLLAKFDNCREVIRRRVTQNPAWRERRTAIGVAADAEHLRGAEGFAAREYFSCWKGLLHQFQWRGRHPHPAPDPVNMLLSLGYGLLHNRLSSALRHAGLNPRMGFFHMNRGRHCALASDLMEPFRAIVDATVLRLIGWNEIRPDQFVLKGGRCVCADNKVFSKLLLAFERMFSREHTFYPSQTDIHAGHKHSVNDALDILAESFAAHISAGSACFLPRLVPCLIT